MAPVVQLGGVTIEKVVQIQASELRAALSETLEKVSERVAVDVLRRGKPTLRIILSPTSLTDDEDEDGDLKGKPGLLRALRKAK